MAEEEDGRGGDGGGGDVSKFREDADKLWRELEEKREVGVYSVMQPELRPMVKERVSDRDRIDVLCLVEFKVGSEEKQVLSWCQGQVEGEVTGTELPIVKVKWDRMADVAG